MAEDTAAVPYTVRGEVVTKAPTHVRVRKGLRHPHNWMQLIKFCAVGGSGYVVNLGVFTVAAVVLDLHHVLAAVLAFVVAITNNFWWNRHWTFAARDGHAGFQAARYFAINIVSFLFQVSILAVLVGYGVPEVVAQASSIAVAVPFNFIANKMWSFGRRPSGR
jgi:putative flippase GtrA